MLTPMIFLGFTILICLASINHNLIEKFLILCSLICIEPRCWQAQPRGRVSGLLLSDMCWIKVNYIKNVLRFLAVCFLIYTVNWSPAWLAEGVSFLLRSNITTLALSIRIVNVSGLLLSDIHRSKDLILDELRPVSDRLLSDMFRTFLLELLALSLVSGLLLSDMYWTLIGASTFACIGFWPSAFWYTLNFLAALKEMNGFLVVCFLICTEPNIHTIQMRLKFLSFYFLICVELNFSVFRMVALVPSSLLSRFDRAFSFCLRLGCRPLFACPLMSLMVPISLIWTCLLLLCYFTFLNPSISTGLEPEL